ncbi:MAG TPA: hypothetical protein VFJ16_13680 [Longimicrobium sp.]|nr:hypothetical protein [Longimicrobium sp.]
MTIADATPYVSVSDDHGLSSEAARLRARFQAGQTRSASIVLDDRYRTIVQQLDAAVAEASSPDWNGYGAEAADPRAVNVARRILRGIPSIFPVPEIAIDPDGEVNLEWLTELPDVAFTMSIGPREISYAGLYGKSRTHGVEEFSSSVPRIILANLSRLVREVARHRRGGT